MPDMILGGTDTSSSCILVADSHIKPDAARIQALRAANHRQLSEQKLEVLIDQFSRVASSSSGPTRFSYKF